MTDTKKKSRMVRRTAQRSSSSFTVARGSSSRGSRNRSTGSSSMAGLLEQLGLEEQEEQLVDAVLESMSRVRWSRTVPVSASDAEFLQTHAGLDDTSVLDDWSAKDEDILRVQAAAASAAQLFADTLSRDEIADALGIGPSRVSHRVRDGQLYVVRQDGKPRFPRWQVRGGSELPGLRTLIPVLDRAGLDPVSVTTFMTVPSDELDEHSPVDYLAAGGDAHRVAALLDAWARQ